MEDQVADYKKRLDELRKAKNTTILKREREVLEVGGPNLGQRRYFHDNVMLYCFVIYSKFKPLKFGCKV